MPNPEVTAERVRETSSAIRSLREVPRSREAADAQIQQEPKLDDQVENAVEQALAEETAKLAEPTQPTREEAKHLAVIVTPDMLTQAQKRRDEAKVDTDLDQYNREVLVLEEQLAETTQTVEWIDAQTELLRQLRETAQEELGLLKVRREAKIAAIDKLRKEGHR